MAAPVYCCFPWRIVDREMHGTLPLPYLAQAVGLGELAKCGLLVTERWGTRVLLGAVITTYPLKPTKQTTATQIPICPEGCDDCVTICPVGAIDINGSGKCFVVTNLPESRLS